jgi:hypothetical protein
MPATPAPSENPDETPRPHYTLKTKEFEALNIPLIPPALHPPAVAADPGVVAHTHEPISTQALSHIATGGAPVLGTLHPVNRPNDIHAHLACNLRHDQAAGHYDLKPGVDTKKRIRLWTYWIFLALVDVPLGLFAWWIGPEYAIPFVCIIAGIGYFTASWTWKNWFLNTD